MKPRLIMITAAALLLSTPTWAQVSSGRILGTVLDTSGGILPGVAVLVRNLDTNITRETVSDTRGQFEVPALPPGRYQIEAELAGFKRYSRGPITVQVTQDTRVDLPMELGTIEETITVSGEGLIVQTTTSTVGRVVEQKQIVELPLSGRNFADLGLLTPGVTTRGQSTTAGSSYVVHGQRGDANNFQLDGVANVSLGGNTLQARPNVDSVQEFKIQTSNFSAEFGRNSGSVVSVVTKSGTNSLSGNTWLFSRDDSWQARNFFATTDPPPLSQKQFGATLGGPIIRNKIVSLRVVRGFQAHARLDPADDRGHRAGEERRFQLPDPAAHRPGNGPAVPRQPDSSYPDQPVGAQSARADAAPQHRGSCPATEQLRGVTVAESGIRPVHVAVRSHVQLEVERLLPSLHTRR